MKYITWHCEDNDLNIEQLTLPPNYHLIKFLGKVNHIIIIIIIIMIIIIMIINYQGTYGYVVKVAIKENNNNEIAAIKKCKDIFSTRSTVKRLLREIKILRLLDHPNIIKIKSIIKPEDKQFQDIMIRFECCDYDLSKLISSKNELGI